MRAKWNELEIHIYLIWLQDCNDVYREKDEKINWFILNYIKEYTRMKQYEN